MNSIKGWEGKKLIELADYINGYAFKPDDWGKDGLPIIRIEQLKNPAAPTDYFSGRIPKKQIIENGDLIFSWSASLFLRIWKHGQAALNQHLFRVVEKEGVDRVFLKLFIEFYLPELTKASHGSTMQHITRKELDRFDAPFPTSKPEQTKIAEILSTVDRAIEQTEALITKQQCIKTGLMQDLLTRGIDEEGNLRSEQTHEFKDSPLGRIPVEWNCQPLRELADIRVSNVDKKFYKSEKPVKLCNYMDVYTNEYVTGEIEFMEASATVAEIERFRIIRGDVIITKDSETPDDIGIPTVISEEVDGLICGYHLALIRPNQERFNSIYLAKQLSTSSVVRYFAIKATGSTRFGLPIGAIEALEIPTPSKTEQNKIASILCNTDLNIERIKSNLKKLRSLKTALMQNLLTGKRRVTALLNDTEAA